MYKHGSTLAAVSFLKTECSANLVASMLAAPTSMLLFCKRGQQGVAPKVFVYQRAKISR